MICAFDGERIPADSPMCPACGRFAWDERESLSDDADGLITLAEAKPYAAVPRLLTGLCDDVWGGPVRPGIRRNAVFLLGGLPGIGKTTLCLQAVAAIVRFYDYTRPALYLGNEQDADEIQETGERLGLGDVMPHVLVPQERGVVQYPLKPAVLRRNPCIAVQDSLPGVQERSAYDQGLRMLDGFKDVAQHLGCPFLVPNHVNSEGEMAGLMLYEHLVSGVLMLEPTHGREQPWRRFRALKNRTGRTVSMVVEMGDEGLTAHARACECHVCKKERKP